MSDTITLEETAEALVGETDDAKHYAKELVVAVQQGDRQKQGELLTSLSSAEENIRTLIEDFEELLEEEEDQSM